MTVVVRPTRQLGLVVTLTAGALCLIQQSREDNSAQWLGLDAFLSLMLSS
jgi:hypothetical protein